MIILKDVNSYNNELQLILINATNHLKEESLSNREILKLSGTAFERIVCETLNTVSKHSDFHNKFEQSTAHAFPDIYAKILDNEWFGIEVKTSQGDWKCFGNSIFETTRIKNLEDRIYIFFGKFSSSQLECRWARYNDCIDNINITHSPRYQINMDIKDDPSKSVFYKMNTSYLEFSSCATNQRMDYVRKYKRKGLGLDVALWWLPDHEETTEEDEKKLVIKLFSQLPTNRKQLIRNQAIAYFPQVFSNNQKTKYSKVLTWLASQHGVVIGNLRDVFSGGGKWTITYAENVYKLPKVCEHLFTGRKEILHFLCNSLQSDLNQAWNLEDTHTMTEIKRLEYWIDLVNANLNSLNSMPRDFPIKKWLNSIFQV